MGRQTSLAQGRAYKVTEWNRVGPCAMRTISGAGPSVEGGAAEEIGGAADGSAGDETDDATDAGDHFAVEAGEIEEGVGFRSGGGSDRGSDAKAQACQCGEAVAGELDGADLCARKGVLRAAGVFLRADEILVVGGFEEAGSAFLVGRDMDVGAG